jgi:hypothetical protein
MSLKSFCFQHKRPLCFIVYLGLAFILFNMSDSIKEGIDTIDWSKLTQVATCTRSTTCSSCTSSYFKGSTVADNLRCAWNSASSSGGSCETSSVSTPIGNFTCPTGSSNSSNSSKPGCTACQKTKLLDTPTWISV